MSESLIESSPVERARKAPHSSAISRLPYKAEPPIQERYFLGIDGGGTKTHAIIADAFCRVIGEGTSGASNPLRAGLNEAISHVESAVREACGLAGIRLDQITAACAAIAGVNHPIHFHTVKDALDHSLGLGDELHLVTDARAALEGALDGRPGVVIIAGTGSIAMGVNAEGRQARSGGWGPTFGDEGSGYDIACRALRAIVSSFDGRERQTVLTDRVCRRLGIASATDLPGVIYNSDSETVEIASLAEVVAEAAREGDEVASDILRDAGRELAVLAVSVIERLGMSADEFRVACVGSVFKSGEVLLSSFRDRVRAVAPGAVIGPPLFPPTIGAVKLAQERCRMTDDGC
ncbi:MAG TPA: BadF/BadG/BcrA/BcrD ATPase family protein [Blastocatellia bacterium]|nr:BadF/BadG/BcrA/BcrD ATPase family protein [Blastocatellia bacterium]